ncbi:MAG: type III pantothenate kinase [Ruminiclostridium sp.]|nr:type III pantothenate kinase [Ruminiclostridium sp.]
MLVAIDVGNTSTTIGLFMENELKYHWRISTDCKKTSDEIGMMLLSLFQHANEDYRLIKDVIICTVVPTITHSLVNAVKKYLKKEPLLVGPGTKTGINIKYENPREVGADKIVNTVGAIKLYGSPLIIVDFGTATTFCAINGNKDYLGGIICPGIKISAEALFEKASKLPRVELMEPKRVIGRNTVTSMQSGMFYGYVGQVEYLVEETKKEMREENIKVIATGGLARLIASRCKCVDEVNRLLTMHGLMEVYNINSK